MGGERVMVLNAHSQQYFSYIVAVSFIGEGNRSNQRKVPEKLTALSTQDAGRIKQKPQHRKLKI